MKHTSIDEFISNLPKAELHIHLEGSLSPETVAELATGNECDFFTTAEEVSLSLKNREAGLEGFLEHYNKALTVLQNKENFYQATYNLLKTLNQNNVVYVELFFDPQAHMSRGISFDSVITGIDQGRKEGEKAFGVKTNLIMCANRERSVESAMEMLDQAKNYKEKIIGFGLDSGPEEGNPPVKFKDVFARAKKEGYKLGAHNDVDQKDSVSHIWESIDILKVDRIDHGVNSIEDPELVAELKKRNIALTACPVERYHDQAPQDVDRIRTMYEQGLCVTLNSDDPAQFESGYMTNMLINFQRVGDFFREDMIRFTLNAFEAAWLPREEKDTYIRSLIDYGESD